MPNKNKKDYVSAAKKGFFFWQPPKNPLVIKTVIIEIAAHDFFTVILNFCFCLNHGLQDLTDFFNPCHLRNQFIL